MKEKQVWKWRDEGNDVMAWSGVMAVKKKSV